MKKDYFKNEGKKFYKYLINDRHLNLRMSTDTFTLTKNDKHVNFLLREFEQFGDENSKNEFIKSFNECCDHTLDCLISEEFIRIRRK